MYSPPVASKNRMHADVVKLIEGNYEVDLIDGFKNFHVKFHGPVGSLYEGGVWKVRVHLPENYPFKSPSLGFVNIIYHPNVDEASGSICLNVLNEVWTALYDLSHIFDFFLPLLLTDPNPNDPLNANAASLYLESPEEYGVKVRQYVKKFASQENLMGLANLAAQIVTVEVSDSESSMSSCDEDGDGVM